MPFESCLEGVSVRRQGAKPDRERERELGTPKYKSGQVSPSHGEERSRCKVKIQEFLVVVFRPKQVTSSIWCLGRTRSRKERKGIEDSSALLKLLQQFFCARVKTPQNHHTFCEENLQFARHNEVPRVWRSWLLDADVTNECLRCVFFWVLLPKNMSTIHWESCKVWICECGTLWKQRLCFWREWYHLGTVVTLRCLFLRTYYHQPWLVGGFKYFLFSPLFGENSHFD